ncbi:endonuclease MutS2 [Bryobacter aggregatus]|uniref:endonuclease MutS2 n=1 Tax=Bryobacter aggregatus TaxID=360054 RepID=UPI0004E21346|nr:Smr/MutS family protein [Bryobacter aggregatus]
MPNWSEELLEYEGLRSLLGRYVSSAAGHRQLEAMQPSSDRDTLEAKLSELSEALEFLTAGDSEDSGLPRLRFTNLEDVAEPVARIRIEGAVLDGLEILAVRAWLQRATEFRQGLSESPHRFPLLWNKAERIADFRSLLRSLDGKIRPDGMLEDDASVALKRLRQELGRQRENIQRSLERFMKSHRDDGVMQDDYVTVRGDRFVVPVAANFKGRVQGVVHGASGSGQTLFVEPIETIQLNNDLVRLIEEELRECHRILRELTGFMREKHVEIAEAVEVMGALEFVFAKARFGAEFLCTIPTFSSDRDRSLHLKQARHPLLTDVLRRKRLSAVPLDLDLNEGLRTLLISGPNTGGKTVAMKTVGLLALMAQSALPVPAQEAILPIFDQVLADIGDSQSIETSLSSFSSHMRHVAELLDQASPDSLVILDEIGRSTDPEEGGALGVAIVDRFHRDGCFTLASTHLLALKIYGVNHEGVLSASMGFDDATLLPTFELRVGAPGRSAGLDTAARFGILPEVIDRARAAMTTRDLDIARFLNELQQKLDSATALEADWRQKDQQLTRREKELQDNFDKRDRQRIREFETKTAKLLDEFERNSRATIEQIKQGSDARKAGEQAQLKAAKFKREFQAEVQSAVRPEGQPAAQKEAKLAIGVKVKIEGVREPAQVLRLLDNGRVEVQAGFLKMQVSRDEIVEVLSNAAAAKQLPSNVRFEPGPSWDTPTREINVIGQHAEEAIDNVDRFLDKASLGSITRVRIIHGHGFGVLKKAIQKLLAKHPHVANHFAATNAEGGSGATIVELR